MPDGATSSDDPKPGMVSKGVAAIILSIAVLLIVMIVGGVIGAILQAVFAPLLGKEARALAFLGPVLVVGGWVYAKYFTAKGNGNPQHRGVAVGSVAVFALLMAVWFANEPPTVLDPAKDAEQLAKPCIGGPFARAGCELNKENIRDRQRSGQ
jgi:uncharacterized membrane-anchored protein